MDSQNISPQPLQLEPVFQQPSSKRLPLIIVVIALLFIFGVGGAYYLGTKQIANQQKMITEPTQIPNTSITSILSPAPITSNPSGSISQPVIASLTPDPTSNWKTYTNQKLGFTIKYAPNVYFREIDPNYGMQLAFEPFPTQGEGQTGPFDFISIQSDSYAAYGFNILQQADGGKTGIDIHQPCGVTITKIINRKFGTYDGVEYIYDGTTPPSGCGRDLIGYEHAILIRKNENEFIKLVNQSMDPTKTRQYDPIFNTIVATLILK